MTDPGRMRPGFGVIGPPDPTAAQLRMRGIREDSLLAAIEAHGVRLAWSRAAACPCVGLNDQTQQPDPLCAMCKGRGLFYFGPKDYVPPAEAGELNELQKTIIGTDAAVIRGVIQRVSRAQELYDILGNWVRGTMVVSVRPENKLGYLDRLTNLDSEVVYSEVVTVATDRSLPLRYPAIVVNAVFDAEGTRYEQGSDFDTIDGAVVWRDLTTAAAAGDRLGVHYTMHPTWLVQDHPHAVRESQTRDRKVAWTTPTGNPTALPLHASVRLEFLPKPTVPDPVAL